MFYALIQGNDNDISHFQKGLENQTVKKGLFVMQIPGVRYATLDALFSSFLDHLESSIPQQSRLVMGGDGWAEMYELAHEIEQYRSSATIRFYADGQHFASIEAMQRTASTLKVAVDVAVNASQALRFCFFEVIGKIVASPFLEEAIPPTSEPQQPSEQKQPIKEASQTPQIELRTGRPQIKEYFAAYQALYVDGTYKNQREAFNAIVLPMIGIHDASQEKAAYESFKSAMRRRRKATKLD